MMLGEFPPHFVWQYLLNNFILLFFVEREKPSLPPPPPPPPAPSLMEIAQNPTTESTKGIQLATTERHDHDSPESTGNSASVDRQPPSLSHATDVLKDRPESYRGRYEQRYRPSQMLSEILKSREPAFDKNPEACNSPIRGNVEDAYSLKQDNHWNERRGYDSPIGYDSPRNSSPPSRRDYESPPRRKYCDSPGRKDYYSGSPRREDRVDSSMVDYEDRVDSPMENYHRDTQYNRGYDSSDPANHYKTHNLGKSPFSKLSDSLEMLQKQEVIPTSDSCPATVPFLKLSESLKMLQRQEVILTSGPVSAVIPPGGPKELVDPNPDLKLVIDRLASYVARNGEEFELGIKEKGDARFDFLNPWNMYHVYYKQAKQKFIEQFQKEKKEGMG